MAGVRPVQPILLTRLIRFGEMPRIHRVLLFAFSNVSVVFLTFSSAMALYRARGQRCVVAFVVTAYLNLLALFWCLRRLERVPPGDLRQRNRLKLAVLVLASMLQATFCYQVTRWMPPAVSLVLWLLTALVFACGLLPFYHGDGGTRPGNSANGDR